MMLANLASVVRASGLPTIEVAGWLTRAHGQMSAPLGVVCHHTVGAPTGDYPSLAVVRDGYAGLPGPLSQLGLGRSGSVYVIAAGLSWHAGEGSWPGLRGNSDCIGIEAESVGDGRDWTAAQLDAYPRLCAALCRGYGIDPSMVIAHREWAPLRKIDPFGISMPALRGTVRVLLGQHGGEGGGEPIKPPQPPKEDDSMQLKPIKVAKGTDRAVTFDQVYAFTGGGLKHVTGAASLNGLAATGILEWVPIPPPRIVTIVQFDEAVAQVKEWGLDVSCPCSEADCRLENLA